MVSCGTRTIQCDFVTYKRYDCNSIIPDIHMVNPSELGYLRELASILGTGVVKEDRTGTGTKSKFGITLKYPLEDNTLPLFTTKLVSFSVILKELLWFLSGSTDSKFYMGKM